MLEPHLPTFSDDAVYLVRQDGDSWGVAPATTEAFFGPLPAEEAATLHTVPLRAVLRLQRASQPRLERIPVLQICRYLTNAFFEAYWPQYCDVPAKRMAFAHLARVATTTAGYRFYFDRSARTIGVLAEAFRF